MISFVPNRTRPIRLLPLITASAIVADGVPLRRRLRLRSMPVPVPLEKPVDALFRFLTAVGVHLDDATGNTYRVLVRRELRGRGEC
jgi:hypothetical protein